ncbi:MAG: HAD family hydrolase [Candidatus Levyibacteriota bacterium]
MIKYLFFDVYQTLLDVSIHEQHAWDIFEHYLLNKNVPNKEAKKIQKLYEIKEAEFYSNHNKILEHHDWIDNLTSIFAHYYKIDFTQEELKSIIWDYRRKSNVHIALYPQVKEVLEELSSKYILATASLAHASITILELEYTGIAQYFKHLYFSSQIGYRKTSPKFYESILNLSGAVAKESVMIGDNFEFDIKGGKDAGMFSIWIKNPLTVSDQNKDIADEILQIEQLEKLPRVIEKMNQNLSI